MIARNTRIAALALIVFAASGCTTNRPPPILSAADARNLIQVQVKPLNQPVDPIAVAMLEY